MMIKHKGKSGIPICDGEDADDGGLVHHIRGLFISSTLLLLILVPFIQFNKIHVNEDES